MAFMLPLPQQIMIKTLCLHVLTLAVLIEHLTYLKAITFYEDGVEIKGALWPTWQVWDEDEYTVTRRFAVDAKVSVSFIYFDFYGIANLVYHTQFRGQINAGAWVSLSPGPSTPLSLLGSLQLGSNAFLLKGTDYLGNTRMYTFKLWVDAPGQLLSSYAWSRQEGDVFVCGLAAWGDMDYVCGPETQGNDLGVAVETGSGNEIVARHVSTLSRNEDWRALSTNTTLPNFFSTTGDHFLELLIRNKTHPQSQRLYRFLLSKTAANYQVRNTTLWLNTSANLQTWVNYYHLRPRPHPEVTTYASVGEMMGSWSNLLMIGVVTWQPSAINIYPSNLTSRYETAPTPFNFYAPISSRPSLISLVPVSAPDFSFSYYLQTMDSVYAATRIRLYWNPIIDMLDGRNYSANCSALPLGYSYAYPASKLRSYSAIQAAQPNLTLITELNQSRLTVSAQIILPSVPFQPNAGILILIDSVSEQASAYINFYLQPRDNLYLTSNKTLYPIKPGSDNVIVNRVQAEDWAGQFTWNMPLYVQNNETGIGSVEVDSPAWVQQGEIRLGSWDQAFQVNVNAKDAKAVIFVTTDEGVYNGSNASSTISGQITLPPGLLPSSISLNLTIQAESRNIYQTHIIPISRVDLCGDGARWAGLEQCDTGNGQRQGSGCWNCRVESGWHCSGGSAVSADVCAQLPSQPVENEPNGNDGSGNQPESNDPTGNNTNQGDEQPFGNSTIPINHPNVTTNDPGTSPGPVEVPSTNTTANITSETSSTQDMWSLPYVDVSFLLISSMGIVSFASATTLHSLLLFSFMHSPATTIISLISQLQLLALWGQTVSPPSLLHTLLSDFSWTLCKPSRLLPKTSRRLASADIADIVEETRYMWMILGGLAVVHILCWGLNKVLRSRIVAALVHFMTFSAYIYWYLGVYAGLAVIWTQHTWQLESDPLTLTVYSCISLLVLAGPCALLLFLSLNRANLPSSSFTRRYGALYECIRLHSPPSPHSISPEDPSPEVVYINSQAPKAFHALRKAPTMLKDEDQPEEGHRSFVVQPTSPEMPRAVFYSTPLDAHKRGKGESTFKAVHGFVETEDQARAPLSACFFPTLSLFQALGIAVLLSSSQLLPACLFGAASSLLCLLYLLLFRPVEGKRYFLLHCLKSLLMALCWLCLLVLELLNPYELELFAVALIAVLVSVFLLVFIVEQFALVKTLFQRKHVVGIAPITATELPPLQIWKCERGQPDITSTDRQTNAKTDMGATERPDLSAI